MTKPWQDTIMIIEAPPKSQMIGILDQNGNQIVKHEIPEPIGFYILRERDDEADAV